MTITYADLSFLIFFLFSPYFCIQGTPASLIKKNSIKANDHIVCLKLPEQIPEELIKPMLIKQGTDTWKELRKYAAFTGSTIYKGLGLSKFCEQFQFLKQYVNHADKTKSINPAEQNVLHRTNT